MILGFYLDYRGTCTACNGTGWIGHIRCARCVGLAALEVERLHCSVTRALAAEAGYCRYCWPTDCRCL